MDGGDIILSVSGLSVSFPGKEIFTAVDDVSFTVGRGRVLAIVGESGSGKSLTALALMGLLPPTAGVSGVLQLSVSGEAKTLNDSLLRDIRGRDIGMVFQEPMSSLNPVMSIGRQVKEAILRHRDISKDEAKKLAIDWLEKVRLPDPKNIYDRFPHQLSGGQKQRVMIAMAMCNHPALLIADEPTTALDVTVQQEIIRLMRYLQEEYGTAMIFITHDLGLAATIADDALVMYHGKAVEYGPVDRVLATPVHPYTRALLASRPSPEKKGYRLSTVADFMRQETREAIPTPSMPVSTNALLDVRDLRVWFPTEKDLLGRPADYFKAVDDVSFTVKEGEVLGLVGESGCGKSTLSRALMGLLPAHGGGMLFEGRDLAKLPPRDWREVRARMQMIFQDPYSSLNPRMTIGDMLREPLLTHGIVARGGVEKEVSRLLDLVGLPADSALRYPHQFSGGQRQRVGIARALALKPRLLICDESVSALDVSVQAQILNLLKDLRYEFGLTYLFISHDLSVVHYISDRVMVMRAGRIVESGDAEQVLRHPTNDYTKKLVAATTN